MKDPHQVLGISPGASEAEIKKAYRALCKKYHPDNYVGNELADLAVEKMKEINDAYEALTKDGGAGGRGGGGWNGSVGSDGAVRYREIRAAIMRGDLSSAQEMLERISDRDAEWYFLLGSLQYRRGWYDEAAQNVRRACQMDPGNAEYHQAQAQMNTAAYQQKRPPGQHPTLCNTCDCCAALMCAECLCGCCQ